MALKEDVAKWWCKLGGIHRAILTSRACYNDIFGHLDFLNCITLRVISGLIISVFCYFRFLI